MKRRAAYAGLLLGLAVGLLTLGCGARVAPPDPAAGPGPIRLRVGTNAIYPPLSFVRDGQLAGIEIDLADKLSRELGVELELSDMAWGELIPALTDGRIDVIMSGMSITPERSERVDFAQPYLRVGQMVLVRREDESRLREPGALERPYTRVGFERATTGERYARANLPNTRLVGFRTPEQGIASLRKDELDCFVHDAPTIWRVIGGGDSPEEQLSGIFRPLTDEQLAWAVRKGDTQTRELLDLALAHWRENGELELVLDRWIRVRKIEREPAPK